MSKYEKLSGGVVRRKERRMMGLFIDGTGLDRATRRISRKVDLNQLVRGVSSGLTPVVARYYTLIPYEDDSRQRAFLDAVQRAGLSVIVKRLPPKGITRQVTVDIEMAADITAFALGHSSFSTLNEYRSKDPSEIETKTQPEAGSCLPSALPFSERNSKPQEKPKTHKPREPQKRKVILPTLQEGQTLKRIVTVVCPSRELAYPISLINELGVETATADFGQFNTKDIMRSAARWIDLSDSETIWRDDSPRK